MTTCWLCRVLLPVEVLTVGIKSFNIILRLWITSSPPFAERLMKTVPLYCGLSELWFKFYTGTKSYSLTSVGSLSMRGWTNTYACILRIFSGTWGQREGRRTYFTVCFEVFAPYCVLIIVKFIIELHSTWVKRDYWFAEGHQMIKSDLMGF